MNEQKEHNTRVVVIANQKGGVGKSTTAVNLSSSLAELGAKVLVLDLDPQGNATSGLGMNHKNSGRCIYNVLIDGVPLDEVMLETSVPGLWIVPATIQLAGAEVELVSALSRETKLRRALDPLRGRFDFIIIDCPPSLGLLTLNALAASAELLVPVQCEYYALEGVTKLLDTVELVRSNLNPDLRIGGVLLTMQDSRTKLSDQVISDVRAFFEQQAFQTVIPRNVRLSEAPSYGQPINVYDPGSRGAEAYQHLAKEVMQRG